jgi:hypothetical protein
MIDIPMSSPDNGEGRLSTMILLPNAHLSLGHMMTVLPSFLPYWKKQLEDAHSVVTLRLPKGNKYPPHNIFSLVLRIQYQQGEPYNPIRLVLQLDPLP